MKKKISRKLIWIVGIGIIVLLIVFTPHLINSYNSYAVKQRESIRYCEKDDDCIVQDYNSKTCGVWSECFNKNEKPLDDIILGSGHVLCDFPPLACKCEKGECIMAR